jgi:FlaA1/EpsC-like NDP-sugar epimerase
MIKEFMIDLARRLLKSHAPRWIILMIDLFVCLFSILLAYMLRFNFNSELLRSYNFIKVVPFVLIVRFITFYIFKPHAGIVRHTSVEDIENIIISISVGSLIFSIGNFVSFYLSDQFLMPFGVITIDYFVSVFFMSVIRFSIKTFYSEIQNDGYKKDDVIIYGTGEFGIMAKQAVESNPKSTETVAAFIEDKSSARRSIGNTLGGVRIYHYSELGNLIDKLLPKKLIIAKTEILPPVRERMVDLCLQNDIEILTIPPPEKWINGELSIKQMKQLSIEDLLEREPIKLDENMINEQCANKTILITGAAGSIGSEITRQLTRYKPYRLILFDQAESPLYSLELELIEKMHFNDFESIVGDICNEERINYVFNTYSPEIVYHAAAYKHVPLMENNPREAVYTNVQGTKLLADISVKKGVQKFILISTDKAVNPTNVMGASKRIAEKYVQSLSFVNNVTTRFITTRFGNVLGSNGSVIPRFRKQIEKGGPITITHPDITRYFMTIPEAAQLVLEAGAMGKGGEIFLFDMGDLVRIADLAKKMIKLSGLTIDKDIRLVYTGLRPGEKLFEELLANKENTLPTFHPKILIAKVIEENHQEIKDMINELLSKLHTVDKLGIVREMKKIVPEYISQNSVYEELDFESSPGQMKPDRVS